jgi:F-type H+-transporting ATPase subunit b
VSPTTIAQLLHLVVPAKTSIEQNQCINSATNQVVSCPTHNFLIPNGTFIFEWIIFILVVIFLAKNKTIGVPRIISMIDQRQSVIKAQFDEAEATKARLEAAEKSYTEALAETRRDASRLREQAQAERADIVREARDEAQTRVEEMLAAASERMATERQQAILALRNEIGELATTLAERVVHDSLREDSRQRKLVADFIAGVGTSQTLESEHAGTAPVESGS